MVKSLHRENIDTLIKIKKYESVYVSNAENRILIDNRYGKLFRPIADVSTVAKVLCISLFHYINLVNMPEMNITDSSSQLNKLSDNEYRRNMVEYLQIALKGLKRLIIYYEYYAIEHFEKLVTLYNDVNEEIDKIYKNIIISTNTSDLENSYTEDIITEMEDGDTDGLHILINSSTSIPDDNNNNNNNTNSLSKLINRKNNINENDNNNINENENDNLIVEQPTNSETIPLYNEEKSEMIIPSCEGVSRYPVIQTVKRFFFLLWGNVKAVATSTKNKISNWWNSI